MDKRLVVVALLRERRVWRASRETLDACLSASAHLSQSPENFFYQTSIELARARDDPNLHSAWFARACVELVLAQGPLRARLDPVRRARALKMASDSV